MIDIKTYEKSGNKPANTKKKSKGGKINGKKILYVLGCLICIGVIVGSLLMVGLTKYLLKVTANDDAVLNLTNLKLSYTSIIYAKDTSTDRWVEYQRLDGEENRIWVDLEDIPENMKNAFIAVEDKDFYKHHGVNFVRTFAAMINEYSPIKLFKNKTGASTITQQLVKNLTNDDEGSGLGGALRKLREIFRALMLEKQYSKDEILEAYLNTLRLSNDWAGVQAGANNYFGKDISELTLAECAMIAGITKSPSKYNPYKNMENALDRRGTVLYLMNQQGMISDEEYNRALNEEIVLDKSVNTTTSIYSYFTDMVIDQVIEDLMNAYGYSKAEATNLLQNGGLKIYSTVNTDLQSAMEEVMKNESGIFPMKEAKNTNGDIQTPQAAMVSVDFNGAIVGVVGGLGEKTASRVLNRAVDSQRQTGSTMKPIGAYALAIEYGYINYSYGLMDDYVQMVDDPDHPGQQKEWPRNYSNTYSLEWVPMCIALRRSLNTCAVRALEMVTPEVSYDFVKNTLHITSLVEKDIDYGPMALGGMTYGVSPLEMAAAYCIFGNEGKYITPYCYEYVEDSSGQIILESKVTSVQAISEETAYIMNRAMKGTLSMPGGTAVGLATKYMDSIGKSGTTSDDKDHWFIGVTPYYSTAVWYGYDDPVELSVRHDTTHPPTRAWKTVMDMAQENLEKRSFSVPSSVVTYDFCRATGCLANGNCPDIEKGYYTEDNLPEVCQSH